ncbi:MAG: hypothetical protein MJ070_01270 [Lachnospiraceae bacterium]|nr:hypothetical protein [Lachnospiraceae bacterium]
MTNENIHFTPASRNTHKRPFDFRLFLEGMRQLRTFAIVILIILSLEAILVPVSNAIDYATSRSFQDEWVTPTENNDVKRTTTPFEFHPLVVGVYLLAAPIMTLMLFSFLNKRNTSDFYHSVPYTRVCLYFSYFAAIMAWIVILAFGSTLLSLVAQWILGDFFIPLTANYFMLALTVSVCSLYVAAVTLLAMTVTGTAFSNVVIALLIMFAPTILFTILTDAVSSFLPIVPDGKILEYVTTSNNIVTATIVSMFTSVIGFNSPEAIFYSWKALLYTGVIGVLALVLGVVLFCFRKSETATQSAPNRKVQAVFRIALTAVFCSLILSSIFNDLMRGYGLDDFGYVIFFIVALVLYCLYELISTKKWKNVLKALPGYLIVLALCGVMLGGMYLVYQNQINFVPDANDVRSVSVCPESNNYGGLITLEEYYTNQSDEIKITDPEIIKIVTEALKENVDVLKANNNGTIYQQYQRNSYYQYFTSIIDKYYEERSSDYTQYVFRFRTGTTTKTRRIYVNTEKAEMVVSALAENENYKKLYSNLPDAVYVYTSSRFDESLTDEELMKVYDIMKFEIASADFNEWCSYIKSHNYLYRGRSFNVIARVRSGFNTYDVEIPVEKQFMPQAYGKLMSLISEKTREQLKEITAFVASEEFINNFSKCYFDLSCYIPNFRNGEKTEEVNLWCGNSDGRTTPETVAEILNLFDTAKDLDLDEPYGQVNFYYQSIPDDYEHKNDGGEYRNYKLNLPLKDSVKLEELIKKYNATTSEAIEYPVVDYDIAE